MKKQVIENNEQSKDFQVEILETKLILADGKEAKRGDIVYASQLRDVVNSMRFKQVKLV